MNPKPIILIIFFIIFGISYYQISEEVTPIENSQVFRIIDGDTLDLATGQRLRLKGINTPEYSMQYYTEAKDLLQSLTQNKQIQIQDYGIDKYGRTIAHIFIDEKNINAKILQEGLATLYYYEPDTYYEELKQAEEFARINQRGLWKKSPNENCIELIELKTDEPEKLILQNNCNKILDITFKDDATHIYKETLKPKSTFTKTFSHIWNNDGDSIYIRDSEGLLVFYRYS